MPISTGSSRNQDSIRLSSLWDSRMDVGPVAEWFPDGLALAARPPAEGGTRGGTRQPARTTPSGRGRNPWPRLG